MGWKLLLGVACLFAAACMPKSSGHCVATGKPQLRTEDGAALDMEDPMAVEASAGRPVLLCAALRPEASGRVVDERTGAGIEGAHVVVESWRASPPVVGHEWLLLDRVVARTFTTEHDGAFDVSTEAAWVPGILAADGFPSIVQRTCVTAAGYRARVFEPVLGSDEPELPERIALEPAAAGAPPGDSPCDP